jgi:DNA-binding NtrC family response regulator
VEEASTVPHPVTGIPIRSLRVEVTSGPDRGKKWTAVSDVVTVGSAPGNDLVLADETVSRYHLELRRLPDRILVEDQRSSNGTMIGPVMVREAMVLPGTVIQLGKSGIRVEDGDLVTVELHQGDRVGGLVGRTPEMRELMAKVLRAAAAGPSVLILGETGTGKELIARALHDLGPRAGHAFETVDCGALLPTLIAAELFGYEKGAFTGADRQHAGAFERADGGTLFLDEIGELPSTLQAALLGVLERRRFRRLGGQKEISVDVRIVAATHRELRAAVNEGTFRQDLYFRLAVLRLKSPALRERRDDLPVLIEHFLHAAGEDRPLDSVFPPQVIEGLKTHHWPGNVRELKNLVDATLAMGEPPELEAVMSGPRGPQAQTAPPSDAKAVSDFPSKSLEELYRWAYKDARNLVLEEFERKYFDQLLSRTRGNLSQAARESRMNRNYLAELLKHRGIR